MAALELELVEGGAVLMAGNLTKPIGTVDTLTRSTFSVRFPRGYDYGHADYRRLLEWYYPGADDATRAAIEHLYPRYGGDLEALRTLRDEPRRATDDPNKFDGDVQAGSDAGPGGTPGGDGPYTFDEDGNVVSASGATSAPDDDGPYTGAGSGSGGGGVDPAGAGDGGSNGEGASEGDGFALPGGLGVWLAAGLAIVGGVLIVWGSS